MSQLPHEHQRTQTTTYIQTGIWLNVLLTFNNARTVGPVHTIRHTPGDRNTSRTEVCVVGGKQPCAYCGTSAHYVPIVNIEEEIDVYVADIRIPPSCFSTRI